MTIGYERDAYCDALTVRILRLQADSPRPWAVLDDTILYPEGGGQPADRGWLHDTPVLDVQRVDNEIRHYLESVPQALETGARAELRLDWTRRYDHMQQHTAQHLLTAVAADELGWETTSFHLGATICDIEVGAANCDPDRVRRLEDLVARHIGAAREVTTRRVDPAAYEAARVRSRGLPQGHQGDIRLVEIDGVDCNTCGGTHLRNTAEIESLALLGTEPMRGGTRLHWVAGRRVRQRLHEREELVAAVRHLFETSEDELVEAAGAKLARLKDAEREIKALRGRMAVAAANELGSRGGSVLDEHFEDADASFLQAVARALLSAGEGRPALLTATGPQGSYFALCGGGDIDLRVVGAAVAAALEGRGGGTPELVQGKAGSLLRRGRALECVAQAWSGPR